jgi:glutamate/aspartate transport system substrate-binding protein
MTIGFARSPDGALSAFTSVFDALWRNPGFPSPRNSDSPFVAPLSPDYAALHPGYGLRQAAMPLLLLGVIIAASLATPAAAQVQTSQVQTSQVQTSQVQTSQVETVDPSVVSGTLAQIKKTGTVRLGYRDASIPFSYVDRTGRPIGYSIDICNAIVEEIGRTLDRDDLKVAFVKVTSETRLQAIVDGAVDLECGSTTNNLERRKLVDFSPMFFVSGTKVMVPAATPWSDFRNLKGRTVAVTRGTTNAQALKALDQRFKLGITLVESPDHEDSYRLLEGGKVDAFATDDVLLYGLIAQHHAQDKFKVAGEFLSYDPYGIGFRRNEPDLQAAVERAVRNLVIQRDIGPLYAKWFESRLPNGERFEMPMSPQLEESFKVLGAGSEPN